MLTLFTIPKPFAGHIGIIQRNAISSWRNLGAECQIILMGNDPHLVETAKALGVEYHGPLATTATGTPLLDGAFEAALRLARHGLICYVNTDILFLDDFLPAVRRANHQRGPFLMVGERKDLAVSEPITFDNDGRKMLLDKVKRQGVPHGIGGIDYFVFRRGGWPVLPPLAVGRPGWDNWLLMNADAHDVRRIDATAAVIAIHQNHDYAHVPGGSGKSYEGPEAERNRKLCGAVVGAFDIESCGWVMTRHLLLPAWSVRRLRKRLDARYKMRNRTWSAKNRNIPYFPGRGILRRMANSVHKRWIRRLKCPVLCLGTTYGGFTICPDNLGADSIVYSFGVGTDISFDLELIDRFGCTVHAFDPTPRSIMWVNAQRLPDGFVFHPWGIADIDGEAWFQPPECAEHVSFKMSTSTQPSLTSLPAVSCPVFRMSTIMKMLHHEHIDLLKMDVEGAEYSVIPEILQADVNIRQMVVELHEWSPNGPGAPKWRLIKHLRNNGFECFHTEASEEEYSFMRNR